MFNRLLTKGLKSVSFDSKRAHIYLKSTDFALVIMRPYDLVQLGDLVGSGSEDILIWTGKAIGKSLCQNIQEKKKPKTRKKLFEELLVNLMNLGYGKFELEYIENKSVKIKVFNSLIKEMKEEEEAHLICNLYNGIFLGSLNSAGADVDLEESICNFKKEGPSIFSYKFEEEV